ncbi:hypothetical protein BC827DRAFT_1158712 [Russula dissimulans]|nr:hypothetical protein BC827DRAFT_1158712 [Russula dissimulans]
MSAIKGEHRPPSKHSALSPSNRARLANLHPWPALFINYAEPGQRAWHQACSTINPQHAAWQAYPEQVAVRAATLGSLPLNGLYSAGLPTQGQAALSQAGLHGHMHSLQPHALDGYVLQSNAGHAPHQGAFSAFSGVSSSFTGVGITNGLADPYQLFFVKDPHMFIMLSPRGHTLTIGNHSYGIPHQAHLYFKRASVSPRSQQHQQQQQQYQNHPHNCPSRSSHNWPKLISNARPVQPTPAVAAPPLLSSDDLNKLSMPARPSTKLNHLPHHQGSPPNPSNLPSQAEATIKCNSLLPSHSLHNRQHNSFDLFLVSSEESESDNPPSTPTKASPPVRPSPKLASHTTGKLARRCQNDVFVPSTPVHSKSDSVQRQQPLIYDDGPRTAPLTNPCSGFSFNIKPTLTPMLEHTAPGLGGWGTEICVLVVSDDELDVRDDVVAASSEVAEDSTREGLNHVGIALDSWGQACEKTFMIIWEVGICVLVVGNDKLNGGGRAQRRGRIIGGCQGRDTWEGLRNHGRQEYVLVIGNDELDVGEDELNDVATSSEVAEDETRGKG